MVDGLVSGFLIAPLYLISLPDDSEAEDDKILPKDNLILVGHVDDDSVCMEVYGNY